MDFNNKHIVVTGASSGIGRQVAVQLARLGAQITVLARREQELQDLIVELKTINGLTHVALSVDLSEQDNIRKTASEIEDCDGVVHAAGIVYPLPVKFIKQKHLDEVFKINFFAPVLLNSALLSQNKIKHSASIVFISSISTKHPYFGGSIYVSSKAALEAYSRNLALELASRQIRSNVVSPALVKTQIFTQTIEASDSGKLEEYEKNYPFGFGETDDVANAIIFLLSSSSRWMTGQEIILDGGLTLNTKSNG